MIKPLPSARWGGLDLLVLLGLIGYSVFWVRGIAGGGFLGEERFWSFVPLLVTLIFLLCLRIGRYSTNGRVRQFLYTLVRYKVFDARYPSYRLVDFLRAAERLAEAADVAYRVQPTNVNMNLGWIIGNFSMQQPPPTNQIKFCIGYEEFDFFPGEALWLLQGLRAADASARFVLRVRQFGSEVVLELAADQEDTASAILKQLADDALEHSIFRGQFIEIRYSATPHRDYDYQFESAEMTVTFKPKPNVTAADIILDEKTEAILRRNLFDFYVHRHQLFALGLPRKRALLFYGPPGTGKTHTCRFIHAMLNGVTTILASGESLTRLQDLGKLARQLQPTLVILEDVDLVFFTRELNPYGASLGDLMDQLDGFTPDEQVIFVLTTNAIERVESAIRDRPGRINQCLFFGMPNPDLRRRYLVQYLKPYDIAAVDLEHIVKQTEGTSQAFLKEYVLRAVQVAAEMSGYPETKAALKTEHFDIAFEELTSHGDPAGHAIMGFRTETRGFGVSE